MAPRSTNPVYGQGIDHIVMLMQADVLDYDDDENTSEVTRSFYHRNALGSVLEITDLNQAEVESLRYDPYGAVTITVGGSPESGDVLGQHWTFTARYLDEETGLYYYRARCYEAAKGRFLQRDPLGLCVEPILYEYCASRPGVVADPVGQDGEDKKSDEPPRPAWAKDRGPPPPGWMWNPVPNPNSPCGCTGTGPAGPEHLSPIVPWRELVPWHGGRVVPTTRGGKCSCYLTRKDCHDGKRLLPEHTGTFRHDLDERCKSDEECQRHCDALYSFSIMSLPQVQEAVMDSEIEGGGGVYPLPREPGSRSAIKCSYVVEGGCG